MRLLAAGLAVVAVAALIVTRRAARHDTMVLALPSAPAPAPAPRTGMAPINVQADDVLRPVDPLKGGACDENDIYYEARLAPGTVGTPYRLFRLDGAKACPKDAQPVPMPLYSEQLTKHFGADSCFCRREPGPRPD